ncbi:32 kDa beta-galactoside-binding lectin [Condylostylus longicornis]|uniref:32 kDa beta-galactoside-binding lectin n=1 Tax=Condylostylus longicornis TaxID=2530218 RepID=UPI00244E5131|nr:32 kDa beta-galactoside-binding lectin [Condylostylus longicornis]
MNIWIGKVFSEVPFGHVLIVCGKIKPNPNKICVGLTDQIKDKHEIGTVMLQIEANFRENQIIRSMYQPGNGWSQEEISKNMCHGTLKNPLIPGDTFNFRIAVLQKNFEIYVNEKLYGSFDHLQSPKNIKYVVVQGDFEKVTKFHHRMLFPLIFPRSLSCCEKMCFESDVPKRYEMGTVVVLEGICQGPPSTDFSICFLCNDTGRIFLKFHVDFGTKCVIRNFQTSDCRFLCENEEREGEFPFKRGKRFKIAFGLGDKAFLIAVNGKFFTYFNFPLREFSISTLQCFCNCPGELIFSKLEYHTDSSLLTKVEKLSSNN